MGVIEHTVGPAPLKLPSVERILLSCGALSSLVYAGANVAGALRWDGYSSITQTVSELSAIDAPSRPIVVPLMIAYGLLVTAFGAGVWRLARSNGCFRPLAIALMAFGIFCLTGPFTPMHLRGEAPSLTDTLHVVGAAIDVVLIQLVMIFAARVSSRGFRFYTIATALVVLLFGALAGLDGPRIAAGLPTPWVGVVERICIGAYLVWFVVLSVGLRVARTLHDPRTNR